MGKTQLPKGTTERPVPTEKSIWGQFIPLISVAGSMDTPIKAL
jgi:hypothetical protein